MAVSRTLWFSDLLGTYQKHESTKSNHEKHLKHEIEDNYTNIRVEINKTLTGAGLRSVSDEGEKRVDGEIVATRVLERVFKEQKFLILHIQPF